MEIKLALMENIRKVNDELQVMIKEKGVTQTNLGAFGDVFYREFVDYLNNGGKRIRPFLVKTAFDAVGGNHADGNIIRASLAIELLHNGSLLHDDVIDKDETRRGKPSFHVIFRELYKEKKGNSHTKAQDFGEAISIFAGDLCFPFAIESIIQSGFPAELTNKALHAFSEAFRDVIDGVIIETGDTILSESTEEEYEKMVYLKTGALIRKAVEIGAILGKGTESQTNALIGYCVGIGKAFQIQDDILGIFGDIEKLGKPVGGDIRENKQTILRIFAMKNATPKQRKRLTKLMGKENISNKELDDVKNIFRETGALENSMKLVKKSTGEAIASLDTAEPPFIEEAKMKLIALSNYLEDRSK
ncbi:MAG: polyprenyl synthetase family protein [Candidatus Heimdallarchaeota archaeon]